MSTRLLRAAISSIVPGWLSNAADANSAFKVLYSVARICDLLIETGWEGIMATFPGVGTPSAYALLAQSRGLAQGPQEPDALFAGRLIAWLTTWSQAGSAEILAQQIQAYLTGQGTLGAGVVPIVRVVDRAGNWVTANADRTLTLTTGVPFPWDSVGGVDGVPANVTITWWSDMWIVVAPPSGTTPIYTYYTGTSDPAWIANFGSNATLGGGHQVPLAVSAGILDLVGTWKGAHTWFRAIIWATDAISFSPASVTADGRFGDWSKTVAGTRIADRAANARYWIPQLGG